MRWIYDHRINTGLNHFRRSRWQIVLSKWLDIRSVRLLANIYAHYSEQVNIHVEWISNWYCRINPTVYPYYIGILNWRDLQLWLYCESDPYLRMLHKPDKTSSPLNAWHNTYTIYLVPVDISNNHCVLPTIPLISFLYISIHQESPETPIHLYTYIRGWFQKFCTVFAILNKIIYFTKSFYRPSIIPIPPYDSFPTFWKILYSG